MRKFIPLLALFMVGCTITGCSLIKPEPKGEMDIEVLKVVQCKDKTTGKFIKCPE